MHHLTNQLKIHKSRENACYHKQVLECVFIERTALGRPATLSVWKNHPACGRPGKRPRDGTPCCSAPQWTSGHEHFITGKENHFAPVDAPVLSQIGVQLKQARRAREAHQSHAAGRDCLSYGLCDGRNSPRNNLVLWNGRRDNGRTKHGCPLRPGLCSAPLVSRQALRLTYTKQKKESPANASDWTAGKSRPFSDDTSPLDGRVTARKRK